MTRYEYKVLKPFSLETDDNGVEAIVTDNIESNLGPDFAKGSTYVDYMSKDDQIEPNATTEVLVKRKFIKLLSPA